MPNPPVVSEYENLQEEDRKAQLAKEQAMLASLQGEYGLKFYPDPTQRQNAIAEVQRRIALLDAPFAQERQRAELVRELQGIANGGGKAYSTVQGQVGAGNRRIAALASTGRGGMNASLNAANAQGQNKIAGQQHAANAQAAEKAQAQSALGQVIAQGQESNNATTAQQIADLQRQYGQAPAENPYAYGINIAGSLGQAAYTAYGQGNNETPEQKNKRLNGG